MKTLFKYVLMLFALSYGISAHAQMSFVLADMTRVTETTWRYNTVNCDSDNNITSITLSMTNNNISSNSSGITPTRTVNSLGVNPRTILYLFTPALTPLQVQNFIRGITFLRTTEISGANPRVDISVDANPTRLPDGATITVWKNHETFGDHPDGTPHYYVWVPVASIQYGAAYNAAKNYYFQGMRGYLPTITSLNENRLLTNISNQEGWSGGARTTTPISDTKETIPNPARSNSGIGNNYKWICGPETDVYYFNGPRYNSSGAGAVAGAFQAWNNNEPNDSSSAENVMQVNYTSALLWNDYSPTNANIRGYFIEFGGSGKPYSVGSATYPANSNYYPPTDPGPTTNNQWEGYSPGNTASVSITFKPNEMRASVLIIE